MKYLTTPFFLPATLVAFSVVATAFPQSMCDRRAGDGALPPGGPAQDRGGEERCDPYIQPGVGERGDRLTIKGNSFEFTRKGNDAILQMKSNL